MVITSLLMMIQVGDREYAWLARHANPVVCVVGAIFMWLLWRFAIKGEEPPNFLEVKAW